MTRLLVPALVPALLLAHDCRAQFLDTFDGTALAPHWEIFSTPEHLTHHVSGGLLTVTDLPLPSHPHMPTNTATMLAAFPPVSGDFAARAIVGWDQGSQRRLHWNLTTPLGSLLAEMTYVDTESGDTSVRVQVSGGPVVAFPGPSNGMHEFGMTREGTTFSAFLNGQLLMSTAAPSLTGPVGRVALRYSVAFPNDGFEPMFADRIEIIPAPTSVALLATLLLTSTCRRRRECRDTGTHSSTTGRSVPHTWCISGPGSS